MSMKISAGAVIDLRRIVAGEVLDAQELLEGFSHDYGQIVRRKPGVVVRPSRAEDVVQVAKYAFAHDLPISSRAVGHSLNGQTLNDEGIVLDMTGLHRMHPIHRGDRSFDADAGTLWRDIVAASTSCGLVPPVLTGYPHVSIGGTHSATGWGTSSLRYGAQIDNCLGFQIVTGEGAILTCTPEENRELFEHALGGFGQFGIITRIRHKLRQYRPLTRTYTLRYDHLEVFLDDNRSLATEAIADHVVCTIRAEVEPGRIQPRWVYLLDISVESDAADAIDDDRILAGLRFDKLECTKDVATGVFAQQIESKPKQPRPGVAHPWLVTFLPWSRIHGYLEECLSRMPLIVLGGVTGPLHLWPAMKRVTRMPMLRVPEEDTIGLVGIFPTIPSAKLAPALSLLSKASDLGMRIGGKRHLATWVHFDLPRWRLHFGDYWPTVNKMKAKYDPKRLLNPGFLEYEPEPAPPR